MEDVDLPIGRRRWVRIWFPVLALSLAIWIVSSIPGSALQYGFFVHWDKVAHAFVFAGLAFLLARACFLTGCYFRRAATGSFSVYRFLLVVVFVSAIWGGVDELHQMYTPGRDVSGYDLLADILGAFGGAIIAIIFRKRWIGGAGDTKL